jgi:hypothetical protein
MPTPQPRRRRFAPFLLLATLLAPTHAGTAAPPDPTRLNAIQHALLRAGDWLASFPAEELRFDAAVGLWHIRQRIYSGPVRSAWRRARKVADRDHDNPLRRIWDESAAASQDVTTGWTAPACEGGRVDADRVVIEALYCSENGWRAATSRYIAGPMRDGGGRHTARALWAIYLAQSNGCLPEGEYLRVAAALQQELRDHQAIDLHPTSTRDVDLYAERLLMLVLTGNDDAPLPEWIDRLLALQNTDGSWGTPEEGEDPYLRYHATMVAAWALATWPQP